MLSIPFNEMTLFTIYKNDSNTFADGYKRTNDKYFIQTLLLRVNEKPNVQESLKHWVFMVITILIAKL
ncbi:hypothetical protein CAN34_04770 [Psychrobacter sp. DAB_AL32B]|nr:hypothetical protein CAN34_04770 [Psychrobacter sp. DAB_AL32B]